MNKSILSIGIVLSLGSVGCAGLGVQHSSNLTKQLSAERGVDSLWSASQKTPLQGAEAPLYAEQELGTLWDSTHEAPPSVSETGPYRLSNSPPPLPRF